MESHKTVQNNISYILNYINTHKHITIGKLMQLGLSGKFGYYRNMNPFSSQSDFYTAPELSGLFGQLIGAWYYNLWQNMSRPKKFIFLEMGSGSGLLLKDIIHVNKSNKDFLSALNLRILEINPILQQQQLNNLKDEISLIDSFSFINNINNLHNNHSYPIFVFANEFLDALPIQQFIFTKSHWQQIVITTQHSKQHHNKDNQDSDFTIKHIAPNKHYSTMLKSLEIEPEENLVYEEQVVANYYFKSIAALIKKHSGLALFIDYGYLNNPYKSSLRGYYKHNILTLYNILNALGMVDITYNVNFLKLQQIADAMGLNRINTISQKEFLQALGITQYLKKFNDTKVVSSGNKLVDNDMGEKFKVLAIFNGLQL